MKRALVLLALAAVTIALIVLEPQRFITLAEVKSHQAAIAAYYEAHPWRTLIACFLGYAAIAATSIPGGAVLSLAAGAIFGLAVGTVLVSFASSLGALAAFLVVRYLLRDAVQRRFAARLRALDEGVQRDGAFYLFALRLVPAIPFFVVNAAMALTSIRPWTYYWVSQLGMLAGTVVYVNAGTQLAAIESPADVFSFPLVASFALLAIFPFIARTAIETLKVRRRLSSDPRRERFDRSSS